MADLTLKNISKTFGRFKAVSEINLTIPEACFCVILGPSGCGKSTLLNLVAGLEEVSSGTIRLAGKDITNLAPHKRNIAMVFQTYALYPHLTVFDNIAFGLQVKGEDKEIVREKVESVSRTLNIKEKLQHFPRQLSGGERQRVATGRAIVRNPELFLFDEPLSNLDARLRIELRAEFVKLHQKLKKTILYVTHDQVEAMSLGQIVVVLKDGLIQQVSSPKELYDDPVNLFVAQFIGTPPMNTLLGAIVKEQAALYFVKDSFRLKLSQELESKLAAFAAQKVYLGFRPSAAAISERTDLSAEVIFTETIGEDSFCHLNLQPDIELTVRLAAFSLSQPKQKVGLTLDPKRLYFFDDRGKRIS
jgi:ABC-type sugar transport system ATPase subunit